jgi:hypothetical protein
MPGLSPKKRLEIHYMQEARRASSIFPAGELVPYEMPDFVLHASGRSLGIEVTELCREEPRAEAGRLARIPDKAKERYSRIPNAPPLDVSLAFSRAAENLSVDNLIDSLIRFVCAHRGEKGSDLTTNELPVGFCHIGIHAPLIPGGNWHAPRGFDTVVAPKALLESRIAEKNIRLPEYRAHVSEGWLLIVNDQSLGPGEVYARPEDLSEWRFAFDFERVLLFSREAGGTGRVIELQRV